MGDALWWIVLFLVASTGTLILGLVSKWIDRKVTARVHFRVGPPWYQPFADIIKLLGKETIVPEHASPGFLLAPLIGFAATCLAATMIWVANINPKGGYVGDLIVVLYLLAIPSLMLVLGGSLSGNPHASVGAGREMKLLLAYELPLILAVLAVILGMQSSGVAGARTLSLGAIARGGMRGPVASAACVVGALIAFFCIHAKLGLVPFDIAEAETEIMGGPLVEYSGPPLALFYMTRAMLFATLPLFLVTVFWGGLGPGVGGWALGFVKYLVIVVGMVLVRNTNPRVRIDHALKFFWFGLTPLGILALAFAMVS